MKIRTITTGIELISLDDIQTLERTVEFNQFAKRFFENAGYEVQTTRISTNSFEEYTVGLENYQIVEQIVGFEETIKKLGISFFNIGYANKPETINLLPKINRATTLIYSSAKIGDAETGINFENAHASAIAIKEIAETTKDGYGNFRFCAWSNCKDGIPFYPASFHKGSSSKFAIGLECGDLVMEAFSSAKSLDGARFNLYEIFMAELIKLEKLCVELESKTLMEFGGIDASVAPSLSADESIAFAYEKLGFGKFGASGTLAISAVITKIVKSLPIKLCGYSGLMLPVCEDVGLAARADEKTYNLTDLLLYSSVCGCGLDTVPVSGKITVRQIENILLDTATLANRLNKPLSVRIFPVPGKAAGEKTNFNSPYLIDCNILEVL